MTDIRKSSLEKTIDKLQMINKYDYIMNEQWMNNEWTMNEQWMNNEWTMNEQWW
jgi:hypothetical protein